MQVTAEGGRPLPSWVAEFLGMGPGPELPALFCLDTFGRHVTLIGFDAEYFALLESGWDETLAGIPIPVERFPVSVMGWPEDWAKDHSLRETISIDMRYLPDPAEVEELVRAGDAGKVALSAEDRALFVRMIAQLRDRAGG